MIHTKQIEGIFATHVAREMAGRHVIGLLELQEMIKRAFDSSGFGLSPRKTAMQVLDERDEWLLPIRAEYDRTIAELRAALAEARQFKIGHVWFWQGDGHDHPESIACPVVMSQHNLRELIAKIDKADALYDSAYVAGLGAGYNLGVVEDNAGLQRAIQARSGYLKVLKDKHRPTSDREPADFYAVGMASMSDSQALQSFSREIKKYEYRDSGPLETADH